MQAADDIPALSHIERTLSDSYRREIDQEENVWRSLPFFTATLALQLTAVFQVLDLVPPLASRFGVASYVLLGCSGLFSLVALVLLAASVSPAQFTYIATDVALLAYADRLVRDEQDPPASGSPPGPGAAPGPSAVAQLKSGLAKQYAEATVHNRAINQRRERRRGIAGLMTICSVVATLLLVATSLAHHNLKRAMTGDRHGSNQVSHSARGFGGGGASGDSRAAAAAASGDAADADRHQGLVGAAGRRDDRRGFGEGAP